MSKEPLNFCLFSDQLFGIRNLLKAAAPAIRDVDTKIHWKNSTIFPMNRTA